MQSTHQIMEIPSKNQMYYLPGTRLHWGKYLPKPFEQYGELNYDPAILQENYPKLAEFLTYREKMDPAQLFVTPYWRQVLSIPFPEKAPKISFFNVKSEVDASEPIIQKSLQM